MHTLALAVLGTCAMGGHLAFRWGRLLRYGLVTVFACAAVLAGMSWILSNALDLTYRKYELVTERGLLLDPVEAKVHRSFPKVALERAPGRSGLDRIGMNWIEIPREFREIQSGF